MIALLALLGIAWLGCSALCALKRRRVYAVGNLLVIGTPAGCA